MAEYYSNSPEDWHILAERDITVKEKRLSPFKI